MAVTVVGLTDVTVVAVRPTPAGSEEPTEDAYIG